ncbi:MAG: hypothetical protein AB1403_17000 [Candidatus Riflebacteria bacterium]
MAYDKIKWHADGEFPDDVPQENAGTHIGMFLAWCFQQGWAGKFHLENEPEAVKAVIDGNMTGRRFLETYCDGTFNEEDLNEEGNTFAENYYATDDYEEDYGQAFIRKNTPTIYHVNDDRVSYERIAKILDKRRKQWAKDLAKRKTGEIELAKSRTADGVLDLKTGALIFKDPDFQFGPKTSRQSFLESPAGRLVDVNCCANPLYPVWKINRLPKLGGVQMIVVVHFSGDKPRMLNMGIADNNPPENPWDPEYQNQRNLINNEWLTKIFGMAREFSWGEISASYDSRSGTSGIFFLYK